MHTHSYYWKLLLYNWLLFGKKCNVNTYVCLIVLYHHCVCVCCFLSVSFFFCPITCIRCSLSLAVFVLPFKLRKLKFLKISQKLPYIAKKVFILTWGSFSGNWKKEISQNCNGNIFFFHIYRSPGVYKSHDHSLTSKKHLIRGRSQI